MKKCMKKITPELRSHFIKNFNNTEMEITRSGKPRQNIKNRETNKKLSISINFEGIAMHVCNKLRRKRSRRFSREFFPPRKKIHCHQNTCSSLVMLSHNAPTGTSEIQFCVKFCILFYFLLGEKKSSWKQRKPVKNHEHLRQNIQNVRGNKSVFFANFAQKIFG